MIRINNISFSYSKEEIIKNSSLCIPNSGSIIGLMGLSGSGKSTLLNLMAGFLKLNMGQIFIKEKDITELKPSQREIGYVFQDYALFPNLTVRENIAFGLKTKKLLKVDIAQKINEIAQLLEIDVLLNSKIENISGGQKQRVALARSIVTSPKVLLLDEVFSAIDNNLKPEIRLKVRSLLKQLNITTILVSHSFEDITAVCDSVCFIQNKSITQSYNISEVVNNPPNYTVASLIGLENILDSADGNTKIFIPGKALSKSKKDDLIELNKKFEKYIGTVRYDVFEYHEQEVIVPISGADSIYLDESKIINLNE